MKPGEVIAFECVDVRVPKDGETWLGDEGRLVLIDFGESRNPHPILRRIEGASVRLPVERAHLDAHKVEALKGLKEACPIVSSTIPALLAHYRAEHAREQAAKRPKFEPYLQPDNQWGVRSRVQPCYVASDLTKAEASAVADALNAREAKP